LAAINVHVDEINITIQEILLDELISFELIDMVTDENEIENYPTEFINSFDLPRFPPHNLRLKIGSSIILFLNINVLRLCN